MWRYRKGNTVSIPGIEVAERFYDQPGVSLPRWVREAAEARGYGDSKHPLSLFINADDISEAFACAAQGNGSACVMAQAGRRIGAKSVYFYRTTAWIDFGEGPIVRFRTSKQIYSNVIEPFDRGQREAVAPGIYHLMPPSPGKSLGCDRGRERNKSRRGKNATGDRSMVAHTDRVVMAAQA